MAWQERSFTQFWLLNTSMIGAGPCLPSHSHGVLHLKPAGQRPSPPLARPSSSVPAPPRTTHPPKTQWPWT